MMLHKKDHSHLEPSAGTTNLLAAVWQRPHRLLTVNVDDMTGGPSSRAMSDCYRFFTFRASAGGNDEEHRQRRGRRLLHAAP